MSKLGSAAAAAAVCAIPAQSVLAARPPLPSERELTFHALHTGERVTATYVSGGAHVPNALVEIDYVLRDWRTDEVMQTDRRLLDLLYVLCRRVGSKAPVEVVSAYRSPKTNTQLAAASRLVAKRSFHMRGMAIDIRLPDCDLKALHRAALALKLGGVGLYSKSGFIHIDTGQVRRWGA